LNHDALNDFRPGDEDNEALMDGALTPNVAALAAVEAISLERVAQDGMRVREVRVRRNRRGQATRR
jgi:hypothetical protein